MGLHLDFIAFLLLGKVVKYVGIIGLQALLHCWYSISVCNCFNI